MKKLMMSAAAIGLIAGLSLSTAVPASADAFNFSFDTGNVAFAYSDGYWDHNHTWHKWRNTREAREYRTRYSDHYQAVKHSRAKNQGWRDADHDGVPNAVDDHPNNPRRN